MSASLHALKHPAGSTFSLFETNREAVRRSFAASGVVEFGKHSNILNLNIAQGLWGDAVNPNSLWLGKKGSSVAGVSDSPVPVMHVDGLLFSLDGISDTTAGANKLMLPTAPTATPTTILTTQAFLKHDFVVVDNAIYICILNAPSGVEVTNPAYFEPRTSVSREDLLGLEIFLTPITGTDRRPFYPLGLVQYSADTFDGVDLTLTSALATLTIGQGYCAYGPWDTVSDGYSLDFDRIDGVTRRKILNNRLHNVIAKDGNYYQWHCRVRGVRGLGNKWSGLDASQLYTETYLTYTAGGASNRIISQGFEDISREMGVLGTRNFVSPAIDGSTGAPGVWSKASSAYSSAETYFVPLATITRFNNGGYHPILNPLGTAKFWSNDGTDTSTLWYNATMKTITTIEHCFTFGDNNSAPGNTAPFVKASWGNGASIGTHNGRPDVTAFDLTYPWQVRDLRLSSYGLDTSAYQELSRLISLEDKGWSNMSSIYKVNGESGLGIQYQKLSATDYVIEDATDIRYPSYLNLHAPIHATVSLIDGAEIITLRNSGRLSGGTDIIWEVVSGTNTVTVGAVNTAADIHIYAQHDVDVKFSSIPRMDVIGSANSIHTLMVAYGLTQVVGMEILTTLPANSAQDYRLARKATVADLSVSTTDIGTTWTDNGTTYKAALESTVNGHNVTVAVTGLLFHFYRTPAFMLASSVLKPVYPEAVLTAWGSNDGRVAYGSVLCSNVTALVPVGATDGGESLGVLSGCNIDAVTKTLSIGSTAKPKHTPVEDGDTSNGVKVFAYLHVDNYGLIWPCVISKQLTYDAVGGYGDDGMFTVADKVTTVLDDNGHTVLVGHWISRSPIGFIPVTKRR